MDDTGLEPVTPCTSSECSKQIIKYGTILLFSRIEEDYNETAVTAIFVKPNSCNA